MQLASWCRDDIEFIFAHSKRYASWLHADQWPCFDYDDTDADIILEYSTRFDFSWMSEAELERVLRQQIALIEQYEPDMVMGDASMTLNMAAEYCQVPCVKIVNGYMTKYYAVPRPLPSIHPLAPLFRVLPNWIRKPATQLGEHVLLRLAHRPFATLRSKYGLTKRRSFLDELEGQTTLICDLPELFPQKQLPSNAMIVGPLFYHKRDEDSDLSELLSDSKKNILVSLGSTGELEHFQWLCDERCAEFNIIVSGRNAELLQGPHIRSRRFINHNLLLPKVDVLLCHGGNGTIYQALSHAVPIVACPNFFEQEYNMQRVELMQLGASLSPKASVSEALHCLRTWSTRKNSTELLQFQRQVHEFLRRYEDTGS